MAAIAKMKYLLGDVLRYLHQIWNRHAKVGIQNVIWTEL